ncbi:MAG TPA: hypothetical protein VJV79_33885 [Polyangiaceae bacterium]|nr:hypothetical protein [Polyangiaceae bacterium]
MILRARKFTFVGRLGAPAALCALLSAGACASTTPAASPATGTASASGTTAAKAPAHDSLSRGGASLFVVHLMSDFDGFKKYFEDGEAARVQAGIQGHLLSRLDDGRVVVHLFAEDAAKLEQVLKSPEMQRYIERKGAPESSLVWLTENELFKLPATPPSVPTFSLYLKLRVTDFAALAREFEQDVPWFTEQGVIAEGLHRSTSKEDIAILHLMGSSREKLEALPKQPEFAALLAHAGSKDEAKPLVGVDVSRSRPQLPANSQ